MSKHVSEWLNAYHDGELHGSHLHQLEVHLAECELCRAELDSLKHLSGFLREVETPEFTPPERFATQVILRLPHEQNPASRKKILEIGWWMIPVGLLAAWIFIGTSFFLSDILSVASSFGLLRGISDWLGSGSSNGVYLSRTIGEMGLLSGNGLNWAETAETLTRIFLPQISLQISVVLLYLSWIAVWWARQTRYQQQAQLIEG